MKRLGLFPRIIIAMVFGIGVGLVAPDWVVRIFATFNSIFNQFLSFMIPLIILGFIIPGIGELGRGAGKLLGLTAAIVYVSTVLSGMLAYAAAAFAFPSLLSGASAVQTGNPEEMLLQGFFNIDMPPVFGVMTALLLSFVIGIGITATEAKSLLGLTREFKDIVGKVISSMIIPLLPIHIAGIFMNMTQAGQVALILQVFLKVFVMILLLHMIILLCQYGIAGTLNKRNPFTMLKTMIPAYFTALGTQSSAATIPVTLKQTKKLGTDEEVANFVVPLCATIHITGSTITITSVTSAILFIHGQPLSLATMLPFILMLGITMIAAPSVPGGGVMAALGLFQSMLGFDEAMISLTIALYIAQDSFGTATNVTGDGAIAQIIHFFKKKQMRANRTAG
ncbi:dicarboxylate/amino acid:cation symporter [Paenibacillus profundus]|uniref:Dicarboxylate/amino acid:cation symporter n=1 Tax=Paenibacillus profundus TaxID=1173085 RepID=A0ABS8YEF3_9BACL|nr:dicarboxylate/amino acid:cation symporter [Paenibacillus profundus]MCE5169937.1 dicarboxylate/amino acid:cation symporter [Paenibacillus profundus]